jgi:hypothetical protein
MRPWRGRGGGCVCELGFSVTFFFFSRCMLYFFFSSPAYTTMPRQRALLMCALASAVLSDYSQFILTDPSFTDHLYRQVRFHLCIVSHSFEFSFMMKVFRSFAVSTLASSTDWSYSPNTKLPYSPSCTFEPKERCRAWATQLRWLGGGGRRDEGENDLPLDV